MKVLHVTSTFPKAEGDGRPPFVADLAAALAAAGVEVRVLAPHAAGLERSGRLAGVPVRRFRYGPAAWERLAYGAGLPAEARSAAGLAMVPPFVAAMAAATRAEARRWRPDVIHAHWWLPGGLSAAAAGTPFVLTLHGSDVALAGRRGARGVARVVARRAAAVVAVSDAMASEAASALGIQVGVARMPVTVDSVPRARHVDGPVRLVAVGRLAPEKGFDVLIEAARRVHGVVIDVFGDGPLASSLQRQAAGLPVSFHGWVPRASYLRALAGADALVVPSRREGLGLVAVEAVTLGVPVIASAVGGLPSVLGASAVGPAPGGVLVPPEDPSGLAAVLAHARDLPAPSGAALDAAARHRPSTVAARHVELYEAALTTTRARTRRGRGPDGSPSG